MFWIECENLQEGSLLREMYCESMLAHQQSSGCYWEKGREAKVSNCSKEIKAGAYLKKYKQFDHNSLTLRSQMFDWYSDTKENWLQLLYVGMCATFVQGQYYRKSFKPILVQMRKARKGNIFGQTDYELILIQEKSMKTSRQCSSLRPNWAVSWVLPVLIVLSHGFFFGALGVLNLKKIISPSSTM